MTESKITLGKVSGVHGIKGWLKIYSYSRPPEGILQYENWYLQSSSHNTTSILRHAFSVSAHRMQGKKLLVKFSTVDSRDEAEALVGLDVCINEDDLLPLDDENVYWRDLIGMTVQDASGNVFGEVSELMETGANDVILVQQPSGASIAIPWLDEVIIEVDVSAALIVVDWQPLEI